MEEVRKIIGDIEKRIFKPVYFLMGEEPYYIDKIANYIEERVLSEDEKGFNQMVLYGKDTTIDSIISQAKRYPMMAEKQVIIVKEAQQLNKTMEQLSDYVANPQTSTVLVFCYKYGVLDKRKKLYKLIQKNGVLFQSKKLYENQVSDWIVMVLRVQSYKITPKAANLLVEFLGTDLSKIAKELEKLQLVLPKNSEISDKDIEVNIGISKDYNNFELKKAIAERNILKATRIIIYFSQNPKDNPFVLTITLLHNFFIQLLQFHGLTDHSPKNVAQVLGVNPYFVSEYKVAAKNYPMKRVSQIVSELRILDMKSKGVDANNIPHGELLKELLVKII